jgi:hypothetical protein
MTQTPARRRFKDLAGNVNHFLITIFIGLDAVSDGSAQLSATFGTSWQPHNPEKSAARSRVFARNALLCWLIDALDAYAIALNQKPFLLEDPDDRDALGSLGRSVWKRCDWLAGRFGLGGTVEAAMVKTAIVWRNRVVHSGSDDLLPQDALQILTATPAEIAATYQGLDVDLMKEHLEGEEGHRFKEVTALVRAAHRHVQQVDGAVLQQLDMKRFYIEALEMYIKRDPPARIHNVWSKEEDRRQKSLRQIGLQAGLGEVDDPVAGLLDESVLTDLAELTVGQARERFLAR